ncbi:leucine-rich repeat domain-containing protein [Bernardetia sp.]|uniref:leucine-rich repeat domain-containing protein n=1 Tax=Bernardetia sp. TaxID=1937974 RepID=UPI0025BBDB87|nr:leucine-rich repeat domain-containing protein [Bernardetia sp.]
MKEYKRDIIIIFSAFALVMIASIIFRMFIGKALFHSIFSDVLLLLITGVASCIIAASYAVFFILKKKFLVQFRKSYSIIFASLCVLICCSLVYNIYEHQESIKKYGTSIGYDGTLEERLEHGIKTNKNWQQDSSLFISDAKDSVLPSNIQKFQHIKSLYISETNIKTLPKELSKFQNLTRLSLSNNKIDTLPEVIFELEQLQELTLGNNNLKYISPNIKKLQNLKFLILWGQLVGGESNTNLPKEIGELKNLTILSLSVPNTDALPQNLKNAENIYSLTLADTRFDEFPPLIFEMTNLEHLTLFFDFGTILPPIPDDFQKLTKLKSFTIRGCNRTPEQKERLQELLPSLEIEW